MRENYNRGCADDPKEDAYGRSKPQERYTNAE
jgi:hypothetical protein